MTTVSQPPAPSATANGSSPQPMLKPVGLPVAPKRQRNTVWMVGGLVLMLTAAIAALSIGRSLADRQDVLVTSRPVAAGETIEDAGLVSTAAALGPEVNAVDSAELDEFAGMVAAGPISEGVVIHADDFVVAEQAADTVAILGADLAPGNYPRSGLQPGDRVALIGVAPVIVGSDAPREARQLGEADVVETARLTGPDRLLVSLRLDSGLSVVISQIADEERLRLVLIDVVDDDTLSPLAPVEPADPAAGPSSADGTGDQ